jgi:uncharacterized GH25 family protein
MYGIQARNTTMSYWKSAWVGLLSLAAVTLCTIPAVAHQLWIETDVAAKVGKEQEIRVCWGHSGSKETGEALEGLGSKLSALIVGPDGGTEVLELAKGYDSYMAKITPNSPGYYMIGSELQVGIINEELYGIPANTRIVMYGKSFAHVKGSEKSLSNRVGFDLEIAPLTDPRNLHPGDMATAKVLFKGKPIGGRDVVVSLKTVGSEEFPEDPKVHSREWSIEVHPERQNGEACFPLIVDGQHLFYIAYFDENPGKYEGDINESSEFSHLRKGDIYERTMYVSTFTIDVKAK